MSPKTNEALTLLAGTSEPVRLEPLVNPLEREGIETRVLLSGDARAEINLHFGLQMQGGRSMMAYVLQHWKTSLGGLLIGVATVAGALEQYGITGGKMGSSTVIVVVAGVATALLGLLAKDPGTAK